MRVTHSFIESSIGLAKAHEFCMFSVKSWRCFICPPARCAYTYKNIRMNLQISSNDVYMSHLISNKFVEKVYIEQNN